MALSPKRNGLIGLLPPDGRLALEPGFGFVSIGLNLLNSLVPEADLAAIITVEAFPERMGIFDCIRVREEGCQFPLGRGAAGETDDIFGRGQLSPADLFHLGGGVSIEYNTGLGKLKGGYLFIYQGEIGVASHCACLKTKLGAPLVGHEVLCEDGSFFVFCVDGKLLWRVDASGDVEAVLDGLVALDVGKFDLTVFFLQVKDLYGSFRVCVFLAFFVLFAGFFEQGEGVGGEDDLDVVFGGVVTELFEEFHLGGRVEGAVEFVNGKDASFVVGPVFGVEAFEREEGEDYLAEVILTGGVEAPVVKVCVDAEGIFVAALDILRGIYLVLGDENLLVEGFEFLYLFGGELDFVAFFDVGVLSYGEEPLEAEVDDGVLEVACAFAVVSFAVKADVAGAAAGDAFKGEGVVAVYIEGPLVAFGNVELRGEFEFVGKGGFVVAATERGLPFHGVLPISDGEGLGEYAKEYGFLGSILSSNGRDLGAQGAIDILESSEFLYVEFLDHNVTWYMGMLMAISFLRASSREVGASISALAVLAAAWMALL